jgi:hypothetical protein
MQQVVPLLVIPIQHFAVQFPKEVANTGKGLAHVEQTPTSVFNQSTF